MRFLKLLNNIYLIEDEIIKIILGGPL